MTDVRIVWFKRDLRIADHRALVEAAKSDIVIPLYLVEPSVQKAPDYDESHWRFTRACLIDLDEALQALGSRLLLRRGDAVAVFSQLHAALDHHGFRLAEIHAHEETGNAVTFERDKAVARWAKQHRVDFTEWSTGGVHRRLPTRDGWQARVDNYMKRPPLPAPTALNSWEEALACDDPRLAPGRIPTSDDLGLRPARTDIQQGGRFEAEATLSSFLEERGRHYRGSISSPNSAWTAGSRLSPYIAYGALSVREILHQTRAVAAERKGQWATSLNSFESRMAWRNHFIQKLEDQPSIEFENMTRAYDGLRENDWNDDHFEAWRNGLTGYPLVDAVMRCLDQTGWINFRMRSMVVSFAANDLWLDWRGIAPELARRFVDYEPGIHYSQLQMQSGVTGINSHRVYNPTKQALGQDPQAVFIRRWVPELEGVNDLLIHEPWRASPDDRPGYPDPIVRHETAARAAQDRIHAVKKRSGTRAEAQRTNRRHGSRSNRRW